MAGVVGWPVAHSLSPAIHRIWMEREGIDGAYLPIAVEAGRRSLGSGLAALKEAGFAGVNVTIPHKEDALALADRASEAAQRIGAANMLTFGDDGLNADNSDAAGFAEAIRPHLAAGDLTALVLGAGGAARAVVFALGRLLTGDGRRISIAVANRTRGRAEDLALRFGARVRPWEERSQALGDFDLLVNATSLGMRGADALDIDLARLPPRAIVADIVYAPLETALLRAARKRRLKTIDGLDMLMRQAVPGYKAWLGSEARVDAELRARLAAELAGRPQ
jgi:shikimate dehydrogenase